MLASLLLSASLASGFADPPVAARPWCYWWWINGHVDRSSITADLEDIRALGFGGVLMFDSRGYWDDENHLVNPKPEIGFMSPAWYSNVVWSVRECARLGLSFTMNASASGGWMNGSRDGKEYRVDILDRAAVREHLDRVLGPVLEECRDLVGTTLTHLYSVSYEGEVKGGGDWRTVRDSYYATMQEWAHGHGLKLFSESGGPWVGGGRKAFEGADQQALLAVNDMPQGEFWYKDRAGYGAGEGNYFTRAVVWSAHAYDRSIASAEAFTHMTWHYSVWPHALRKLANAAFADGINHLVWHTYTASHPKFGFPGVEYFAGTHINRNVTWHDQAAPFVKFLGRCQFLLQQGKPVVDLIYRAGAANSVKFGRFRDKTPSGEPVPPGYNYDYVNDERWDAVASRYPSVRPLPDCEGPVAFAHRRTDDRDIYFVEGTCETDLVFRVSGRTAEIWDPVTGEIRAAKSAATEDGRTRVSVSLPAFGSMFVVFSKNPTPGCVCGVRETRPAISINGPWDVQFGEKRVCWTNLEDWTKSDDDDIRYFSGTAIFRTTFDCTFSEAAEITLGNLLATVAEVKVNGTDCGVVWTAPWMARIPAGVLKAGKNELEIRVTNCLANRLVREARLPPEQRTLKTNMRFGKGYRGKDKWGDDKPLVCAGYFDTDELFPCGFLGPVLIK